MTYPAIVVGSKDITRALYSRRMDVWIRGYSVTLQDLHHIRRSISPELTLFGVQLAPVRDIRELEVGGKLLRMWAMKSPIGSVIEKVRLKIVRISKEPGSDPVIHYRMIYPPHYLGCEGTYRASLLFEIDSPNIQSAQDEPFFLHYRTVKPKRRRPMPVIIVYGIPKQTEEQELVVFAEALRDTIASIPELGLEPDQVSVFFPPDRMKAGLGEEIIVFVEGLLAHPRRTRGVKQALAHHLGEITAFRFPLAYVECFVRTFATEEDALFTRPGGTVSDSKPTKP